MHKNKKPHPTPYTHKGGLHNFHPFPSLHRWPAPREAKAWTEAELVERLGGNAGEEAHVLGDRQWAYHDLMWKMLPKDSPWYVSVRALAFLCQHLTSHYYVCRAHESCNIAPVVKGMYGQCALRRWEEPHGYRGDSYRVIDREKFEADNYDQTSLTVVHVVPVEHNCNALQGAQCNS